MHPVSSSTAAVTAHTTRDSDAHTTVCTTADSAVGQDNALTLLPDITTDTTDNTTTETITDTEMLPLLLIVLPIRCVVVSGSGYLTVVVHGCLPWCPQEP